MNERRERIYAILKERGSATVEELTRELYASEATVRRDLAKMEQEGLLVRVWGGAVPINNSNADLPAFVRSTENISAKKTIAYNASGLIKDNMSIFLSSGTTVTELSKLLGNFENITVITNGLDILNELNNTSVKVITIGGELYEHYDFVGGMAEKNVEQFNTDIYFFSCSGITADGFTSRDMRRLEIMRKMHENSAKTVLLTDTSKVGKKYTYKGFDLEYIDYVVMEKVPSDAELKKALEGRLLTVKK